MIAVPELKAFLYDGESAERKAVIVKLTVPGYLVIQELGSLTRFRWEDVVVPDRLGSQPARINLPSGALLEVPDANAFYTAYAPSSGRKQWLHAFESRWSLVVVALFATIGLAWAGYIWGVPAAAQSIAYALPVEVDEAIGSEGLILLDGYLFEPSELEPGRIENLRSLFAIVVETVGGDRSYQLEFRSSEKVGANAFALPAGIIVITDAMVNLAEDDEELAAVFAHEVGHVRNRHALRKLIQNSVVAGAVMLVTGDIASAGNLAAGVPTVLANADYSRAFELDADVVAREYLLAREIPLHRFADIIIRLSEQKNESSQLGNLLSSHPAAVERAANFR